jgi:hypothetical protein
VRWTLEEKKDKARKLYLDALNRDMNNRGALFNLGVLDTEEGEYEREINWLQMARKTYLFSWGSISENDKFKPQRSLVDKKECETELQLLTKDEARNLVVEIRKTIKTLQKTENTRLRDLLESFKPLEVIMCAGIFAGSNEKGNASCRSRSLSTILVNSPIKL